MRGDNLPSQLDYTLLVALQLAFVGFLELNYFFRSVIIVPSNVVVGEDIYREGPSSDICPKKKKKEYIVGKMSNQK